MLGHRILSRLLIGTADDDGAAPSRFGPAGRGVKTAVRQAMAPSTTREQRIDEAASRALIDLALLDTLGGMASEVLPSDAVVDLDTELGAVLFHAADRVITPFVAEERVWEADETAFLRATLRPGDVFVDCGANVGWFSVLATRIVGPEGLVVAIEPEARNLALLRRNLWRHQASEIRIAPVAAGSGRGLVGLHLDEDNRGDHQVHAFDGADRGRRSCIVPVIALDELLGGAGVDVVKIDVQGGDADVVAGLAATLAASRDPVLLVEYWLTGMEERGVDPAGVLTGYRDQGFDLSLLQADGSARQADDDEVLEAAAAHPGRYVNLILRRR